MQFFLPHSVYLVKGQKLLFGYMCYYYTWFHSGFLSEMMQVAHKILCGVNDNQPKILNKVKMNRQNVY